MSFQTGPFSFDAATSAVNLGGVQSRRWSLTYANDELAIRTLDSRLTQDAVREAFSADIAAFVRKAQAAHEPARIDLIDSATDEIVAHFRSDSMCDMRPSLVDDRDQFWIRSADRKYARSVSLSEFAQVVAEHRAPGLSWIAGLLPEHLLTHDANAWRAPTSWEIRHVVGEGSFTGVSGAKAAEFVGVTASNFRKYTARDGANSRQAISYAMWHLLLHRLGVQYA